jgi:hypothetical protein
VGTWFCFILCYDYDVIYIWVVCFFYTMLWLWRHINRVVQKEGPLELLYLNESKSVGFKDLSIHRDRQWEATLFILCYDFYSQEQLRRRKETEDRIAAQNEFLRTSLRGSNKLQALESTPPSSGTAFINDAYEDDASDDSLQLYAVVGEFSHKYPKIHILF